MAAVRLKIVRLVYLSAVTNSVQARAANSRVPPERSVVSRTRIMSLAAAASTHSPPLLLE
jgi:hypothetical protein